MECPLCGSEDSKVINSRSKNDSIRRRRECLDCGARFFTEEVIATIESTPDAMFLSKAKDTARILGYVAQANELARRSRNGIIPFSQVPTIPLDTNEKDYRAAYDKAMASEDQVIYDDDKDSLTYLSIVVDTFLLDHHDIVSVEENDPNGLAYTAMIGEDEDDIDYLFAPIPGTQFCVVIYDGKWSIKKIARDEKKTLDDVAGNVFRSLSAIEGRKASSPQ